MIKNYQGMVSFKDQLIPIEELIGISKDFIFFNPTKIPEGSDFKIQSPDMVFLLDLESHELLRLDEVKEFNLLNSKKELIATSEDLRAEIVESLLTAMEKAYESNGETKCN